MERKADLEAVRRVMTAAWFAAQRHASQKRKGAAGEPYINHLIEVAQLVSSALPEPDTNLVMAALLHDSIEDTGVSKEELAQRFGTDVADLVAEVTDDKTLDKRERKRLQVANAPKKSVRAQALKTADKTSNLRGILTSPPADWSLRRRQEYIAWAKQVVDAFPAPNPILKAEFESTYAQLGEFMKLTCTEQG